MQKLLSVILTVLMSISSVAVFAKDTQAERPLEVGIIPYLSPRVLITHYEPMRLYLENTLGRPVKIYTATSFKQFLLNAQKGDYDLVFSAAHFARMLQLDQKYTPVARYASKNRALIVTSKNGEIKSANDLKGQVIAVPDLLSLSSIVAFNYLHEAGLQSGTDFKIQEVPSFISAILSIQKSEAVAAISAPGILAQMPKELSNSVTTVIDAGEYLRMVILTHPRVEKNTTLRIQQSLLKLPNDPILGKDFLSNTKAGGIVPATFDEMKSLDRYIPETKRLLGTAP